MSARAKQPPPRPAIFLRFPSLRNHFAPAAVAIAIAAGILFVTNHTPPLIVTDGHATPSAGYPGDKLNVQWAQEWHDLCPVQITREIATPDGWAKKGLPIVISPPDHLGLLSRMGGFIIPPSSPGVGQYRVKLEPRCFIDHFWQRTYYTPPVQYAVLPPVEQNQGRTP